MAKPKSAAQKAAAAAKAKERREAAKAAKLAGDGLVRTPNGTFERLDADGVVIRD